MKIKLILLFGITFILIGFSSADAQLLYQPESVVYDSSHSRYLVSNWDSGDMIQIDSNGVQDYFIIDQHCYAGLHIVDDVVYVAGRNQGIRGFDLETGQMVMQVNIPGSGALNDVTSDDLGNLYVSTVDSSRIYKINTASGSWNVFVSSGLSSPNGLYFDEPHNRLLLVSSRNMSPLQAISLDDSTLTTLVYTGISILDGLTMDEQGNVYFSSWSTHSIYRYDSTFTNPPELISTHSPEPADISYDAVHDCLAVPIFYGNYIEFVEISQTSGVIPDIPSRYGLDMTNYPNPFNAETVIEFNLNSPSHVSIEVFDIIGRKMASLQDGHLAAGRHRIRWDTVDRTSGIYFYRFQSNDFTIMEKMTLLK